MTTPGQIGPEQVNQIHRYSDVDIDRSAQHHTLGSDDQQASPGSHRHLGSDGSLVLDGYSTITHTHSVEEISGFGTPQGAVLIWPGASASIPTGFLECDGSAVSRSTYADLFSIIGTAYGSGDGSTTFNLPDFRFRFPMGGTSHGTTGGASTHGHSASSSSGSGGSHSHGGSITINSNGSHTHTVTESTVSLGHTASSASASASGHGGGWTDAAHDPVGDVAYSGPSHNHTISVNTHSSHDHNVSVGSGGSHSHTGSISTDTEFSHSHTVSTSVVDGDNLPPYLTIRFIIKT